MVAGTCSRRVRFLSVSDRISSSSGALENREGGVLVEVLFWCVTAIEETRCGQTLTLSALIAFLVRHPVLSQPLVCGGETSTPCPL